MTACNTAGLLYDAPVMLQCCVGSTRWLLHLAGCAHWQSLLHGCHCDHQTPAQEHEHSSDVGFPVRHAQCGIARNQVVCMCVVTAVSLAWATVLMGDTSLKTGGEFQEHKPYAAYTGEAMPSKTPWLHKAPHNEIWVHVAYCVEGSHLGNGIRQL